jgi:hypothetical protein
MAEDMWPVTIVTARYGGIYEPGRWLAFAHHPQSLPDDWDAGDVACAAFWSDPRRRAEVGGGDNPQDAYDDLLLKMKRRRFALRRPGQRARGSRSAGEEGLDAG